MSLKGFRVVSESASQKSAVFFNELTDFSPQLWGWLTLPCFSLRGRNDVPCVSVSPEWDVSIRSYVLRTNYEEYAVILMKKKSSFGPSTTLKLYGMSGYGTCGRAGSGVGQCSSETPPKGSSGPLALRDLTMALEVVPWTSSSSALSHISAYSHSTQ